jgi:hypothetical protein
MSRVTAVFDNQAQAEQAVAALRQAGIADTHLSFVGQQQGGAMSAGAHDDDDAGSRAGKGLLAGAGVGTLFGLAAALIPGVGPFITAGALATALGSAVAGGAVSGAIVGGTSGAIAGALAKNGYNEHEANYYGSAVENGSILVAVDSHPGYSDEQVRGTLSQYGGRSYSG